MLLHDLEVEPAVFEAATGWAVKPEGACKAEQCVALAPDVRTDRGTLDVAALAAGLGMPVVADDEHHLWAVGPETAVTGRALSTARAPAVALPDADGNVFQLSSLLGQKVVLIAWASW